jgi:hypothetical protein
VVTVKLPAPERQLDAAEQGRMRVGLELGIHKILIKDLPRMPMQLDQVRPLEPGYGALAIAAFEMSVTTLRSSSQISRW